MGISSIAVNLSPARLLRVDKDSLMRASIIVPTGTSTATRGGGAGAGCDADPGTGWVAGPPGTGWVAPEGSVPGDAAVVSGFRQPANVPNKRQKASE
jgi:hypothetical protein